MDASKQKQNIQYLTAFSKSKRAIHKAKKRSNKASSQFDTSNEAKEKFYTSCDWQQIKQLVYIKYKNSCFCCGSITDLQIDHIYPISTTPQKALMFENLQILCGFCNKLKSNKCTRKFSRSKFKKQLDAHEEGFLRSQDYKKIKSRWRLYFYKNKP